MTPFWPTVCIRLWREQCLLSQTARAQSSIRDARKFTLRHASEWDCNDVDRLAALDADISEYEALASNPHFLHLISMIGEACPHCFTRRQYLMVQAIMFQLMDTRDPTNTKKCTPRFKVLVPCTCTHVQVRPRSAALSPSFIFGFCAGRVEGHGHVRTQLCQRALGEVYQHHSLTAPSLCDTTLTCKQLESELVYWLPCVSSVDDVTVTTVKPLF